MDLNSGHSCLQNGRQRQVLLGTVICNTSHHHQVVQNHLQLHSVLSSLIFRFFSLCISPLLQDYTEVILTFTHIMLLTLIVGRSVSLELYSSPILKSWIELCPLLPLRYGPTLFPKCDPDNIFVEEVFLLEVPNAEYSLER